MDEPDSNSLFTEAERESHRKTEHELIAQTKKQGNFEALFKFWQGKRKAFLYNAFVRNPADA